VLEMRPNCECCDRDLSPDSSDAFICSFECTFCRSCAETVLARKCINCGGDLVLRPQRAEALLDKFPASTRRISKPGGCREPANPSRPY